MDLDIEKAARIIDEAEVLIIGAGAGLGVDSGLPDFRGTEGFWRAYPVFKKLGYSFEEMANPEWFQRDPRQAWGFYGHRLNAYRNVEPHSGFQVLKKWIAEKSGYGFVFTSNVDGHFQKAGFREEQIYECHGSIHWLQSAERNQGSIWSAEGLEVDVDHETCKCMSQLPVCPDSGCVARPNILMFGDWMWNGQRSDEQEQRLRRFLTEHQGKKLVAIELGAGKVVPTVRINCERITESMGGKLVRINPRDSDGVVEGISISTGAEEALLNIDKQRS